MAMLHPPSVSTFVSSSDWLRHPCLYRFWMASGRSLGGPRGCGIDRGARLVVGDFTMYLVGNDRSDTATFAGQEACDNRRVGRR